MGASNVQLASLAGQPSLPTRVAIILDLAA